MTTKKSDYGTLRFTTENAQPTQVISTKKTKAQPQDESIGCFTFFSRCGKKTEGYSRISEKTPLLQRWMGKKR